MPESDDEFDVEEILCEIQHDLCEFRIDQQAANESLQKTLASVIARLETLESNLDETRG